MANNFFTYKNYKVGKSLVEENTKEVIEDIYKKAELNNCKILIPEDCLVGTSFDGTSKKRNLDEVKENFDLILSENNWSEKDVLLIKDNLKKKYGIDKSFSNNSKNAKCFLTNCENLIASDGSILISSNQIHEKKLLDFPNNLIILSHTKKLRNNISEGLAEIKSKGDIPTNITTIKNFNLEENSDDFLSYGTASKNLYLIMLEKGVN